MLGLAGAIAIFAGCASSRSDTSGADQLDQSTSAPAAQHGNPLDTPDESTLSHVPGQ